MIETLAGLAVFALTLWQIAKTRAELTKIRSEIQPQVDRISHEVHPNGGSSMRDAVNQTRADVTDLKKSIGGIRDDAREDRRALEELRADKRDQHAAINNRLSEIERMIKRRKRLWL